MLFGKVSLEQGIPLLKRHGAVYLTAVDDEGQPIGALGFMVDDTSQIVKGIELIGKDDEVRGQLCARLVKEAKKLGARIIEANVSAYDSRLQKTFLSLGFFPAAYVPAMVYHEWERLDVIKMLKLNVPYEPGDMILTEEARATVSIVQREIVLGRVANLPEPGEIK
jgi:hypothetical protein